MSVVLEWADELPPPAEPDKVGSSKERRQYFTDLAAELRKNPNKWAKVETDIRNHSRQTHFQRALELRLSFEGEIKTAHRRLELWIMFVPYEKDIRD